MHHLNAKLILYFRLYRNTIIRALLQSATRLAPLNRLTNHQSLAFTCAVSLIVLLTFGCGGGSSSPSNSESDPSNTASNSSTDPHAPPAFLTKSTELEYVPKSVGSVTFAKDVAPILYNNCTPCHHPGGVGPFPFITYEDVKERGHQIAFVTQTRYMPPWLPTPGYVAYKDERGLTDEQIGTLKQWVEDGMPAGDLSETPAPPRFKSGWQLGTPDKVVTLEGAYELRADGGDVFRNFVIPNDDSVDRWIQAVEFNIENKKVVHHATLEIDPTRSSRRLDLEDPTPGYEGMHSEGAQPPSGHFVGWVPGRIPTLGEADQAWELSSQTDLVLQLHMLPSGKPELVKPELGLHFAEHPPARIPFMIRLGSRTIDLPAGAPAVSITDQYRLPVAVSLRALAPHAHYLCQEMLAWVNLPNGSKRWLLHIEDWDFNWQDDYRFRKPIDLPAGSVIHMKYTYDNSAANPQNPTIPPQHVSFGPNTFDEMGDLWVQMYPTNEADRVALQQDYINFDRLRSVRRYETLTAREPDDATHWNNLGHYRMQVGDVQNGLAAFDRSLQLDQTYTAARKNRAVALFNLRQPAKAEQELLRVSQEDPSDASTLALLGRLQGMTGRSEEAKQALTRSLSLEPNQPQVWEDLARVERALNNTQSEVAALKALVDLEPTDLVAIHRLTRMLSTHPDPKIKDAQGALTFCELGMKVGADEDPVMLQACASAYAAAKLWDKAVATAEQAASRAQALGVLDVADEIRTEAELYRTKNPLVLPTSK